MAAALTLGCALAATASGQAPPADPRRRQQVAHERFVAKRGLALRRMHRHAATLLEAQLEAVHRRVVERVALFHDIGKIHEALFDIVHDHKRLSPAERPVSRSRGRVPTLIQLTSSLG